MSLERTFRPRGRRIAWFATLLGVALVTDGVWSATATAHVGPAVVVAAIGLERLVHAAVYYWNGKFWPWRLRAARLTTDGLEFGETHAYDGADRTTVVPGGLLLKASVDPGDEHDVDSAWVVVLYSILGTVIWSEHADRSTADRAAGELQATLDRRPDVPLEPPKSTGAVDILADDRAVMWGKPRVIPIAIIVRSVLLLGAIFTIPALVHQESFVIAAWLLVFVTAALLAFPFVGAVSVLGRGRDVIGFGAAVQQGELRAWEHSAPDHLIRLRNVRHVGFDTMRLDGDALAMKLVAHTASSGSVESYVARSPFVQLAAEAYRLVAESYDPGGATLVRSRWSVRLPGGVAEAIEAVSWMQRFVAEARAEP